MEDHDPSGQGEDFDHEIRVPRVKAEDFSLGVKGEVFFPCRSQSSGSGLQFLSSSPSGSRSFGWRWKSFPLVPSYLGFSVHDLVLLKVKAL